MSSKSNFISSPIPGENLSEIQMIMYATQMIMYGTGSMYNDQDVPRWRSYLTSRSPLTMETIPSPNRPIDTRSPKDHLENIRRVINPPISELAKLFNVSRQAIYKWLAQSTSPEEDKLVLLTSLSKIADNFADVGIERAGFLLNMKNSQGTSLFDLLKNNQPHEDQVNMLINEVQKMKNSKLNSSLKQLSNEPTDEWMSSISIPAYPEDQ